MRIGLGLGVARGGGAPPMGVSSVDAEITGAAEITFTLATSFAYAGVEWGIDPALTWTKFDATQTTSHEIVLGAADGLVVGTTYAYRPYATADALDAPENRNYGASGTISLSAGGAANVVTIEGGVDAILLENGVDYWLVESGSDQDVSDFSTVTPALADYIVVLDASAGVLATVQLSALKTLVQA